MSSTSFGEWYEAQKRQHSSHTDQSSWIYSFWKSNSSVESDVEAAGFFSNASSKIHNINNTMKEVFGFFGLALVFFAIAYFIGLPTLLLRPAKFSISFMMGSFMTIAGLARMQGYSSYIKSMFSAERRWKSVLYILSLILSMLCAIVWKSYLGTIVSSIFQIFMLSLFVLESFPAGSRIASLMTAFLRRLLLFITRIFVK